MATIGLTTQAINHPEAPITLDEDPLAAPAFLARYRFRALDAYRPDRRALFQWAAEHALAVLAAIVTHVRLYRGLDGRTYRRGGRRRSLLRWSNLEVPGQRIDSSRCDHHREGPDSEISRPGRCGTRGDWFGGLRQRKPGCRQESDDLSRTGYRRSHDHTSNRAGNRAPDNTAGAPDHAAGAPDDTTSDNDSAASDGAAASAPNDKGPDTSAAPDKHGDRSADDAANHSTSSQHDSAG